MNEKMTVFFRKRNLEIINVCEGEQNLRVFASLELEDAKMIYDFILIEDNKMVLNYMEYYEIYKNDKGEYDIKLKDESKDKLLKMLGI